ncbi:hypothetical protein [Nonomuraea sp. NPDC001831]
MPPVWKGAAALEEAKTTAEASAREADAPAGELLALLRQRDTPPDQPDTP